jgi:hypothetical protein
MPVKWNTRRNKQSDKDIETERERAEAALDEMFSKPAEQAELTAAQKAKEPKFPRRA